MSQITQLASAQLTAVDVLTIELVETSEHPTVVIVRWPDKPTVMHPRRFPSGANTAAAAFAAAIVKLAHIRRERKL